MIRKILVLLLIALVIIQFIHPKKNKAEGPQIHYIGTAYAVPENVKSVLAKACNDCHSNNTIYPWYAKIQPVHWWLNNHITEGKKHLNYDEYTNRPLRFQYNKLKETIKMIDKGEMPLESYTWVHKDARLTEEEKSNLKNWAGSIISEMEATYPKDSLIRKK